MTEPAATTAVRNAEQTQERLQRLLDEVAAGPHRFDFFALLRAMEALSPTMPRLARAARPRDEPLRLAQDPELDFAPAAISSLRVGPQARPVLGQRFFGLFGPMGPLPLHLTEYARERRRQAGDPAFARFADIFHHRALLLFYRAWAQAQPTTHLDRPTDNAFSRWVASLYGAGHESFERRDRIGDDAKRYWVGFQSRGVKTAEGLRKILAQYFEVPVRLEPHVLHQMDIAAPDRTRLARHDPTATNALGRTAVIGHRVWDRQSRFRLHVGPLDFEQYERFLPDQAARLVMRDWVRHYVGTGQTCDVVVWIRGSEVPRPDLGCFRGLRGRLGRSLWLGSRRPHADRGDLRLRLDAPSRIGPTASEADLPSDRPPGRQSAPVM